MAFCYGGYMIAVLLFGIAFAYLSRNFSDTVSGSRVLVAVIILSLIFMISTIHLTASVDPLKNVESNVLLQTITITVMVLLGLSLLIFPTYFRIVMMGDLKANEEYIHDLVATAANNNRRVQIMPIDVTHIPPPPCVSLEPYLC
jgi:hypothetical protein